MVDNRKILPETETIKPKIRKTLEGAIDIQEGTKGLLEGREAYFEASSEG